MPRPAAVLLARPRSHDAPTRPDSTAEVVVSAALFTLLAPRGVIVRETTRGADDRADRTWWLTAPAEERNHAMAAVPARRSDLAVGRRLAHAALDTLGADTEVIGRGARGEPLWPAGVVGSITHCEGYAAAAVADSRTCGGLGLDVEPNLALPPGVLEEIAGPAEQVHLAGLARQQRSVAWDRLLFCVKEAVYKTWYPLERRWLGFEDVTIVLDTGDGTFEAAVDEGVPRSTFPPRLGGHWGCRDGFVAAMVALGPVTPPEA